MWLGKWGNFVDIEGIQWVDEIKLFGITYTKIGIRNVLNYGNKSK